MPDLPVAAPDPAKTIRRAMDAWRGGGTMRQDADAALAALLAERQQVDAALDSLETILFGDCQQRSRDELDMRAQELVAERQQDKERIEGLGGVIGIVLPYISTPFDRGRAAYALAWQAAPEHAKRGLRAPAALAVEEDARDQACVARWPECEPGGYDPRCCRFPKSCSCLAAVEEDATP